VESCLERITAAEMDIRAWAKLRVEGALADARRIDASRDRDDARPLLGIPIGVKDIICTADIETSAGSPILDGWRAPRDAVAVTRLKRAGAILLGKTATTAFASGDPAPTRNPVDTGHTPGGSSSGSAAAVRARFCLGALGTQTAGSIVRPSAYCGVVGFKPTYDSVSRDGVVPLAWSMDHVGPIGFTVGDVRSLYQALVSEPIPTDAPAEADSPHRFRVGVPDSYFTEASDEVLDAFAHALDALRLRGWEVTTVALPDWFELCVSAATVVMPAEIASVHEDWFAARREEYGPKLRATIEVGRRISASSYLRAQRIRRMCVTHARSLFDGVDFLVTPSTPMTAPPGLESTGDPRFNTPFSSLGLPALTIPVPAPKTPLPVGLQFVGRYGSDRSLLAAGQRAEDSLGYSAEPC
jgi:aspartyl-tRNA(Asn)/glutamyl-tRNA(Gln) amidotransferase subunit A